ncbi:MAG: hypothetical protein WDN69_04205 [Aliidongia sp.]
MKYACLTLAGLLLPMLAAAETPADYQASAPITLQGDGPYYRLTLPIGVHFAAHCAGAAGSARVQ